jgi:hypothetical protein
MKKVAFLALMLLLGCGQSAYAQKTKDHEAANRRRGCEIIYEVAGHSAEATKDCNNPTELAEWTKLDPLECYGVIHMTYDKEHGLPKLTEKLPPELAERLRVGCAMLRFGVNEDVAEDVFRKEYPRYIKKK